MGFGDVKLVRLDAPDNGSLEDIVTVGQSQDRGSGLGFKTRSTLRRRELNKLFRNAPPERSDEPRRV